VVYYPVGIPAELEQKANLEAYDDYIT
jgi:hypothetical protein